jgi:hypothetical protein
MFVIAVLLAGLVLFAFVFHRRKRQASAAKCGPPADVRLSNGAPAASAVGTCPRPAQYLMPPAAVFPTYAPSLLQEAAAPASPAPVFGRAKALGAESGWARDRDEVEVEVEDDSEMLAPSGLPPISLLEAERSGTGSSTKVGGILQAQVRREASSMGVRTVPKVGGSSTGASSRVVPVSTCGHYLCVPACQTLF